MLVWLLLGPLLGLCAGLCAGMVIGSRTPGRTRRMLEAATPECPHVWGKWEDDGSEKTVTDFSYSTQTEYVPAQRRECEVCGLRQRRKIVAK